MHQGARFIVSNSYVLKRNRVFGLQISNTDFAKQIRGLYYQIYERIMIILRPNRGEEILLIAKKK